MNPGLNPTESTSAQHGWLGEARRDGFLGRLPDSAVASLVKGAQRVEYPPGTIGLRWDQGPRTAILVRGTLRAYISFPDGGQVTTRYLKAGDMTGVFAPRLPLLARGVQAIERSELMLIDSERMKELALSSPEFAWALIEELTTVLHANQRALYIRAYGTVRQRVVASIVDRAKASGQLAAGRQVSGTQQELATAVGSVREVVATVLGNLKHERLIDVRRGGVVILEPDRLADEAAALIGPSG